MSRWSKSSEIPLDQWFSLFEFQRIQPDCKQYLWLSEYQSMTKQLTAAAGVPLQVEVLSSINQVPHHEERLFLTIASRKRAYIREVLMYGESSAWMYGRTIIPAATLKNAGAQLKLLGDKPLGKVLFHHNPNARQFIEVARISRQHHLYPQFNFDAEETQLWARRSLFLFEGAPLMVQEVFLPSCPLISLESHQPEVVLANQ